MMTAVIIDDEEKIRSTIKNIISVHDIPLKILGEADNKNDGAELLVNMEPDVILLDVMLGEDTSFDMLRIVGELKSKVIFISGFEQYALEAFKFSAVDYILKPVDPEELELAVEKLEQQLKTEDASLKLDVLLDNLVDQKSQEKKIVLQTTEKTFVVQIQDILRCESNNNYTRFYLRGGEKLFISKPIKHYDELLANYNFFRVHKSHLVNMEFVQGVIKKDNGFVELVNGDLVPISSRKRDKTMSIISQMGIN